MRALIDGDMPAHEIGHLMVDTGMEDEQGNPIKKLLNVKEAIKIAVGRLMSIAINSEAGGYTVFLTGKNNFRDKLATILGYKANRAGADRGNVDKIKEHFHEIFGAIWCDGFEADDAMAMEQWDDLLSVGGESDPADWNEDYLKDNASTVIASRDKDLQTVPGWHYKWFVKLARKHDGGEIDPEEMRIEKGEVFWVSYVQALRNFYAQMLTGDVSDNIPGLYKIGPKSAWVKQLDDMDDEQEMYDHVQEKYYNYFKNHWRAFLLENARLLHMWRKPNDEWLPPDERDEDYWK